MDSALVEAVVSAQDTGLVSSNAVQSNVATHRLSFEAEAAPRGYDVITASSAHTVGSISVRQTEIPTSVHNKHQIELHCGPAVIAQPVYSDPDELELNPSIQYVTLEEFFDDKSSEVGTSTVNQEELSSTLQSLEAEGNVIAHQQCSTPQQIVHHTDQVPQTHQVVQVTSAQAIPNSKASQMPSSPLTPSPSSTSSQDYDLNHLDESHYKFPTGVHNSISTKRSANHPAELNFRESMISRVPTSPPGSEGTDDEMYPQDYSLPRKEARRRSKKPVPDEKKDDVYWRRRLKNNIAAKRSREARRQKEGELSKKAAMLEIQHEALKTALEHARKMNDELRIRLSKYEDVSGLKVH